MLVKMSVAVGCGVSWVILITYLTTIVLAQTENPLKLEVEQVSGIILPPVPNDICMYRQNYDCRWTYEKSCNCRMLKRGNLWRVLEITFIRKRITNNKKTDVETHECQTLKDKCIVML